MLHPEHVAPLLDRVLPLSEADRFSEIFGLLADPNRSDPACPEPHRGALRVDLPLLVGMGQSAMSHQLRLLPTSLVVERRNGGRIVYHRLADEHVRHVLADGLRHSAEEQALRVETQSVSDGARPARLGHHERHERWFRPRVTTKGADSAEILDRLLSAPLGKLDIEHSPFQLEPSDRRPIEENAHR